MAALVGHFAVVGSTTDIHTSAQNLVGTRAFDAAGNEYVYMRGVASCIVGSWVVFDELYLTTLTVANSQGRVAIAQAIVDASTKFGWWGVWGSFVGAVVTGADDANVWVTSTAGKVDNTDVAVDIITGALQRSATAANLATFEIAYPFANNIVLN